MINKIAKKLAANYLNNNEDPTTGLVKVAQDKSLTAQQIERVANKANRKIIVGLQKEAVSNNPHFTFPTVKSANVIAIIKKKKSPAEPSVPDSKPDFDVDDFFPSPNSSLRSRLDDDPERMAEEGCLDFPSRDIGMATLNILKHKASLLKSKLGLIEIKIEEKMRKLEKQAHSMLLTGTPKEVIESVTDKVAHVTVPNPATADFEFEIEENHPFCKLAEEIEDLEKKAEQAREKLEEKNELVEKARKKL